MNVPVPPNPLGVTSCCPNRRPGYNIRNFKLIRHVEINTIFNVTYKEKASLTDPNKRC